MAKMNTEIKTELLEAYDSLNRVIVSVGRGKASSMACGYCLHPYSSGEPHPVDCPIGQALHALNRIVPPYSERDKWLAED
jgi:hypothetical protein